MRLLLQPRYISHWLQCMKAAYYDLGMQIDRLCLSDSLFEPFVSLFMQSGYGPEVFELKQGKVKTAEGGLQVFDFFLLGVRVTFTSLPVAKHLLVLSEVEGPCNRL